MKHAPDDFTIFFFLIFFFLFAQVVGDVDTSLPMLCDELGIRLTKEESRLNVRPLLRLVFQRFLGDFTGFTEMVAQHIPSPLDNAATKVQHIYGGNPDTKRAQDMINCDADDGHLMIHSTKQYPNEEATSFHVRVLATYVSRFFLVRFFF